MTKEGAIKEWVIPAIKNTWNEKRCKEILEALEQEPKTGHWVKKAIETENDGIRIFYECSECGHREPNESFIFEDINFCAKCGAKMEKGRKRG